MTKAKTMKFTTKILFLLILINLSTYFSIFAQSTDKEAVIAVVDALFDGMREADSEKVDSLFLKESTLISIFRDKKGVHHRQVEETAKFAEVISTHKPNELDEKIWSYDVNIDRDLATVWTDYTFYAGSKLSHCGVNAFHLYNGPDGWKITQITDTRKRTDCRKDPTIEINTLMDNWHKAAATADEKVFFGSMGKEDATYIGTDASERWTKTEFETWSKKYFEQDKAWDFTPIERQIHFSVSGETAWFNETLDTWMGICRSSGIVERVGEEWLLQHYHLSVTLPNELVKGFLELIEKE